MPMVRGHWRRMLRRLWHLVLSGYDNRETVHDGHHHSLVTTATSLSWIPPTTLFIYHRPRKHRSTIKVSWIALVFCGPGSWRVTFRAFEESHHMRLESVRLADRRRQLWLLVLIRLGVRMVALHGHRVPHAWWYHVRQALDCVGSINFVPRDARYLVHSDTTVPGGSSSHFHLQHHVLSTYPMTLQSFCTIQFTLSDKASYNTHCTRNW